ncbi:MULTISPECIES: hypothetical protein [Moorena]|nr:MULTISPECIES: hypothetical protein [Moorena]
MKLDNGASPQPWLDLSANITSLVHSYKTMIYGKLGEKPDIL